MDEELLEIVDEHGEVIAIAPRSQIHGNPSLAHRVVHVLVFNRTGQLLLQQRSLHKDVAPGKWDTSVGGHVDPGESLREAAQREMSEELGINAIPEYLYSYVHTNDYETEMVYTFICFHEGPFNFNPDEVDDVRFWSMQEIEDNMQGGELSDNFKHEITTYLKRK